MAKSNKNTTRLNKRRDKVKSNKHNRKYVDWHPDIPGLITAIYCKGCGTQIKGLNKDRLLIPYWNYREIEIEFDDGSSHLTPICNICEKVKGKDNLEAIYIADLDEFDRTEDNDENVWDLYLDRVPEKLKDKTRIVAAR